MNAASDMLWNVVAPIAQNGVLADTGATVLQETVYSKIIRKMIGRDKKGWVELFVFSLMTQTTDGGLGAWYGQRKGAVDSDNGFMNVAQEIVRPLLSCVVCNYILRVGSEGLHNPMKSFGFVDLLIQLGSKDLTYGMNTFLSANSETMRGVFAAGDALFDRQTIYSRLLRDTKGEHTDSIAKKKAAFESRK